MAKQSNQRKKEVKKPKKGKIRKVQRQFDSFAGLGENSTNAINRGY